MKIYKNIIYPILIITAMCLISCNNKEKKTETPDTDDGVKTANYDYEGDKLVVTDKIMYDVPIVNEIIADRSKECPDWFWENLPTPDADIFLKTLLEDAASGKLKTYYYEMTGDYESFDVIPQSDLKAYMDDVMTYTFEIVDTTVKRYNPEKVDIKLDYKNVKKLRFLEEWFVANGKFYKQVIAIAPYFVIEYPGMETINAVYFWVLIDDEKPDAAVDNK